jgi:dihydrofolate reductase
MKLTLIAAVSDNNVIGFKDKVPWKIKEDMVRFKQLTTGHPVIMGRKTYESIPEKFRPLPDRKNIILSKTLKPFDGIHVAGKLCDAIRLTEQQESYVMGGGQIYELFLPFVYKMELTKVHSVFEGDTFFPDVTWKEWELVNEEKKVNDAGLSFSFETYVKMPQYRQF